MKTSLALISVSDKRGIVDFARGLDALGIGLLSTGGSAKLLREAGLPVTEVSEHTGFPEMLDGRVKTLHPKVHAGILARRDSAEHLATLAVHAIPTIDLVVVNLYPFQQTVAKPGCTLEDAIENIDIGGPTMVRAAAKNHGTEAGGVGVVGATAAYAGQHALRYGENPHQQAAFYREPGAVAGSISSYVQLQGKELSYNNIADADAAWECVKAFGPEDGIACVIVKHANPCGVALADSALEAYRRAFATDPTSAFGGIIAFNVAIDRTAAEAVAGQFAEVIIAPAVTPEARAVFAAKQNLRVLEIPLPPAGRPDSSLDYKRVGGGLMVQTHDAATIVRPDLKLVTRRAPSEQELRDLLFAWKVAKFVKSNAIVYCQDGVTVGVGAGQMSRVDSARIAAIKAENAGHSVAGSVVASDAFFPFRDGLDVLAQAGATAVIQPCGSVRDAEVIAAADEQNIAMVFTGFRHFRH